MFSSASSVASASLPSGIHHEKQILQLCAIHALNHIIQHSHGPLFTATDLNNLADSYHSGWRITNPHRSIWGTGNFDADMCIAALSSRSLDCSWFDKRRAMVAASLDGFFAVLINHPTTGFWSSIGLGGRHWRCLRKFRDASTGVDSWWDLDSLKEAPVLVGDAAAAAALLAPMLSAPDKQLIGVRPLQPPPATGAAAAAAGSAGAAAAAAAEPARAVAR